MSRTEPIAMICPDADAPESSLKAVLSFFGSVRIGRPWFMDEPVTLVQSGVVEGIRPPQDLKPPENFKAILAEYRAWARTSHDRGFDAFLAFKEQQSHGEEATWEIRAELRRREGRPDEGRARNALKWNLFLHLAQEIQKEEREAEELLRSLKKMDSPLKGAIEEEGFSGPLADLPEWEDPLMLSEPGMALVLEAWFSLFQSHWSEEAVLLTLSPAIFQHLYDTWEEWGQGPALSEMEFFVPDFSRLDLQELLEAKARYMKSEEGMARVEALVRFLKGHPDESGEKPDAVDLRGLKEPQMLIRLKRFTLVEQPSANAIVRHLSGKTIGIIRVRQRYGE